jgi:hypothetical protein
MAAAPYFGAPYLGLAHLQALFVDRRSPQLAGRARTVHLTPIDRYAACHGDDGLPFDPLLMAHARLGGVRCEARSMEISAPVEDWEAWTAMAFPEDGEHVFPRRLAPLRVTRGIGTYWEPNVWVATRCSC